MRFAPQERRVVPQVPMLSIFALKHLTSVPLAVRPDLAGQPAVAAGVCAMFGVFNGYFWGRLPRDVGCYARGLLQS
jgi:hypothetical protein